MQSSTSWRRDWVIDPDPLAAAQARHRPSGFGLSIKSIGAIRVPHGEGPFLATIYTDDSRPVMDRQFAELGAEGSRRWIEEKQEQARTIWRELGLDVDPAAKLPEVTLCEVTSWRSKWNVQPADGRREPDLVHDSGFAVRYVYAAEGEDNRLAWLATTPEGWADRAAAAEATLGAVQVQRLRQEAEILWMEQGFFAGCPSQLAKPFSADWRTLWAVREHEGEQWLVHASGLAVTPTYGVVEDDGTKGWTLHLQPGDVFTLDCEMRRRVGQKAWDRIHDQGWQLSVEMGYVSTDTSDQGHVEH